LRRFSICSSSRLVNCTRVSFVTPSTISATSPPNCRAMSSWVMAVSSMQSCSSAATMLSSSSPISAQICAAATQCVTYGVPALRFCPLWARSASSNAARTRPRSTPGLCSKMVSASSR